LRIGMCKFSKILLSLLVHKIMNEAAIYDIIILLIPAIDSSHGKLYLIVISYGHSFKANILE